MTSSITLVVSVDTEEDNWEPAHDGLTVENARELPKFAAFCERLGIRPTYFANYQVASRPWAAQILREIAAGGRAEVGAHLHPWNTPPYERTPPVNATMLCNYPLEPQEAKIRTITAAIAEATGVAPTSFRAGRFGLGTATVAALLRTKYQVDCSVTPFFSWQEFDRGPDFLGAPVSMYRLDGRGDVRVPVPDGPIVEVPVSAGFTRFPVERWLGLERLHRRRAARALRLPGLAARLGLVSKTILSPETTPLEDMLALSRRLLEAGVSHLHLFLHSSSLRPGTNPFVGSRADLERLHGRLERYLEHLARLGTVVCRTAAEAAAGAATMPPQPLQRP